MRKYININLEGSLSAAFLQLNAPIFLKEILQNNQESGRCDAGRGALSGQLRGPRRDSRPAAPGPVLSSFSDRAIHGLIK